MTSQAVTTYTGPSAHVLDLFALPQAAELLEQSRGAFVAGDLVLSRVPGGDRVDRTWLSPKLARLAVALDEDPRRATGAMRIAMPVPARDGSIVVDGWEAHRFEPGSCVATDIGVVRAVGRLLHARLATWVQRPEGLMLPDLTCVSDRDVVRREGSEGRLADSLIKQARVVRATLPVPPDSPAQLVHSGLPGRVLIDRDKAPVVLQVIAAWDSPERADARCLVEAIVRGAHPVSEVEQVSRSRRTRVLEVLPDLIRSAASEELPAYAAVLGRTAW